MQVTGDEVKEMMLAADGNPDTEGETISYEVLMCVPLIFALGGGCFVSSLFLYVFSCHYVSLSISVCVVFFVFVVVFVLR
jgi:hypothetical protein